jgi:hypothetical protein
MVDHDIRKFRGQSEHEAECGTLVIEPKCKGLLNMVAECSSDALQNINGNLIDQPAICTCVQVPPVISYCTSITPLLVGYARKQ